MVLIVTKAWSLVWVIWARLDQSYLPRERLPGWPGPGLLSLLGNVCPHGWPETYVETQGLLLRSGMNMQNPDDCPWPVLVLVCASVSWGWERKDFLVSFKNLSLACWVVNGVVT